MALAYTTLADLKFHSFKESTTVSGQPGLVVLNPDGSVIASSTIAGGNVAHDAADSGNPIKIGGRAVDPASLPSAITANDRSDVFTSLQGEVLVYKSRLDAGEDQTNGLYAVVNKPLGVNTYCPDLDTSAAAEASSVSKAASGVLYSATFTNGNAAARYFQLFNSATVPADTTVPVLSYYVAAGQSIKVDFQMGSYFSNGISWCTSSTSTTKTVGAADAIARIEYK